MKKLIIIMTLTLLSFQLFAQAEGQFILQGMMMNTTRNTEGSYKYERSFTSVGVNLINFRSVFSNLGFYSNVSFLLPTEISIKENNTVVSTDLKKYDMFVIDLDMIVGPGYNVELGKFDLLLGGGLHFNGVALMSNNTSTYPYLSYVVGAGAGVTAAFNLSEVISLTATVQGGYDFYEIYRIPELAAGYKTTANLTYAAGLGLGFKF